MKEDVEEPKVTQKKKKEKKLGFATIASIKINSFPNKRKDSPESLYEDIDYNLNKEEVNVNEHCIEYSEDFTTEEHIDENKAKEIKLKMKTCLELMIEREAEGTLEKMKENKEEEEKSGPIIENKEDIF